MEFRAPAWKLKLLSRKHVTWPQQGKDGFEQQCTAESFGQSAEQKQESERAFRRRSGWSRPDLEEFCCSAVQTTRLRFWFSQRCTTAKWATWWDSGLFADACHPNLIWRDEFSTTLRTWRLRQWVPKSFLHLQVWMWGTWAMWQICPWCATVSIYGVPLLDSQWKNIWLLTALHWLLL